MTNQIITLYNPLYLVIYCLSQLLYPSRVKIALFPRRNAQFSPVGIIERLAQKMARGQKKTKNSTRSTRYQRNLQIAIIVISILLVLSMALSLAVNI